MSSTKNDNSIVAIKRYISHVKSRKGNITNHNAMVLTKGEGYPDSTCVGIIKGDCYTVIIETLPQEFITNSFKSDEYIFEYHNTNTLIIKGIKDLSNNDRTINISYGG